jgi:hypothetical protein
MKSVIVCISLNPKTLEKIDNIRGLIPRSAWIGDILNKNLKIGDPEK